MICGELQAILRTVLKTENSNTVLKGIHVQSENRATIGFGSKFDVMQLGASLMYDEGIMMPSYGSSGILTWKRASLSL